MTDRSAEDRNPLDRLTPGEREVLVMLAGGHTAKTIATSLGLSVAAVNERLRGARRRTGAGSSRELARRLVQQNRDEFSGLAATDERPSLPGDQAPSGRWTTRRTVMIASAALAAVLALTLAPKLAGQAQQAATGQIEPETEILASLSSGPTPDQLRHRFRDESGDNAWAIGATPEIQGRYTRLPAAARHLEGLSISCGATLCQVIGWTRSGVSGDDIRAVMNEVQSRELNVAIEQLGLTISSSSFTAAPNDPDGMAFVSYLERKTGG
ncbi:helix-turn-helix transcriptional regulator [Brevundimonas sp.]|uniref:helix-turn-helix domain-containing protein n=1 Tax=Brevundimonas sp. TaxID=1871086 RepID=UPI0011F734C8|nr:helix-turn-helix transcriptional regulator [Brevundimonas sp.]TAJ63219.1 MAG: LuxR family transcriptional regulator [Brevundimonas sp.]